MHNPQKNEQFNYLCSSRETATINTTNNNKQDRSYTMNEGLKEIILYGLVSISSLCILAFTVHMFVGGLVEKET